MFARIISALTTAQPARTAGPEGPRALAALMVRLARSDDHYSADEAAAIDRLLAARYGLSAFEAGALRRAGETLESEAPDTVRFTRAIKDAVPHEDRMGVIEAMWAVALSDGARGAEEDALLRLVATLLGISDRDSAVARQRVTGQRRAGQRGAQA
jgi:uncharacterized tellurite resistance protein B-like protein